MATFANDTAILSVARGEGRGGCPSKKFGWTHLGPNGSIVLK